MERLTNKREADQQRRNYEKRLEQGYPRNIPEERFLRLAAYEDTGLEPEDIKKAFNEDALLKMTAQYLGTTPDCLHEWAKAAQEGRLIVMPCKVGDTVYAIRPGCEICPFALVPCESEATEFCGKDVVRDLPFAIRWLEDIGKRYFLTREEAEAALAGEGGKDAAD